MDNDAICIGCGCTEFEPCQIMNKRRGMAYGCAWVVVDRRAGIGVCSTQKCRAELPRWDRGDRKLSDQAKKRSTEKAHG